MTFLPIVERELRVRARRKSTYRFRMGGALLAILLVAVLLFVNEVFARSGTFGSGMFRTLAGLTFLYCLLEGARNTADCLSEEKRAGTLGLLFLTDLKGYDVVLGKLMATSLNSFYALLAVFPPLAIPLFVGGVTVGEFWRLVLALLVTLFFSLTAGLFVSASSRREQRAWSATLGLVALFVVVPPLLGLWPALAGSWPTRVSPVAAFFGLFDGAYSLHPDGYWTAVWSVHLLSWFFLAAASFILPRAWHERPPRVRAAPRRQWPFPGAAPGKSSALLARNPVLWLAARHDGPQAPLRALLLVAGAGAVAAWFLGGGSTPVAATLLAVGLGLHLALALWVASRACHAFAEARDSGALELLLSTPLTVKEILDGHFLALKRLFWWPVLTLLSVEVALFGAQIFVMASSGSDFWECALVGGPVGLLLAIAVMDLYAVAQFGLWMGLSTKKPSQAITRTVLYVLVLPLGTLFCFVLWPVTGIVKNLIFINYSRDQLRRYFRALVTERFAAGASDDFAPVAKGVRPPPRLPHLPPVLPR